MAVCSVSIDIKVFLYFFHGFTYTFSKISSTGISSMRIYDMLLHRWRYEEAFETIESRRLCTSAAAKALDFHCR